MKWARWMVLNYKADYILVALAIFIIVETVAMLVQGKLFYFSPCHMWYGLGIGLMGAGLGVYLFVLHMYMPDLIELDKQRAKALGREYVPRPYDITCVSSFSLLVLFAMLGGFLNGFLGSGVGSVIVLSLLFIGMPSAEASATSGFQIVFTGASSLLQAFSNGQITG